MAEDQGAEASLLEIGVEALKTDDYGGFSNEEISSIQQNICKDLGKLDPFRILFHSKLFALTR